MCCSPTKPQTLSPFIAITSFHLSVPFWVFVSDLFPDEIAEVQGEKGFRLVPYGKVRFAQFQTLRCKFSQGWGLWPGTSALNPLCLHQRVRMNLKGVTLLAPTLLEHDCR